MNQESARLEIPSGKQRGYRHLLPIAKLLIERGHPNFDPECDYGFFDSPGGFQCKLGRAFTPDDWQAVNDSFVVPDSIVFFNGLIRDNLNRIDMMGVSGFRDGGGHISFDEWEERERRAGRRK